MLTLHKLPYDDAVTTVECHWLLDNVDKSHAVRIADH